MCCKCHSWKTREHWIQRITFAAETNATRLQSRLGRTATRMQSRLVTAACSRGSAHGHTDTQTPTTSIPSPLAKRRGEGKMSLKISYGLRK